MEDLPLDKISALVPEFAVKNLPLGRTLMMMMIYTCNMLAVPAASLTLKSYLKRFITLYGRQCVSSYWLQCFLRHGQLESTNSYGIKIGRPSCLNKHSIQLKLL